VELRFLYTTVNSESDESDPEYRQARGNWCRMPYFYVAGVIKVPIVVAVHNSRLGRICQCSTLGLAQGQNIRSRHFLPPLIFSQVQRLMGKDLICNRHRPVPSLTGGERALRSACTEYHQVNR
jgi:hypothetical protein